MNDTTARSSARRPQARARCIRADQLGEAVDRLAGVALDGVFGRIVAYGFPVRHQGFRDLVDGLMDWTDTVQEWARRVTRIITILIRRTDSLSALGTYGMGAQTRRRRSSPLRLSVTTVHPDFATTRCPTGAISTTTTSEAGTAGACTTPMGGRPGSARASARAILRACRSRRYSEYQAAHVVRVLVRRMTDVDMYPMTTRVGVFAAFAALALAGCASDNPGPQVLRPPGVFTLASMGHADQTLTPGKSSGASATTTYLLPEGARQGGPTWYRLRLHYRAKVSEQSGPGTITIWANANDEAVAAIDLEVRRLGQRLEVVSSSVGLVEGGKRGASSRLDVEGTFSNFLVYGGVRPGLNELRFDVQQMGAARAESVTIYEDTALVIDEAGPATIELVPALEDRDVRVGEPFVLRYEIRNTGGVALPAGGELAISLPRGVVVTGLEVHPLARVPGGGSAEGEYRLPDALGRTRSGWPLRPGAALRTSCSLCA